MSGFKPFDPNSSSGGSFDPTTDMLIEELINGRSVALTQSPTGLGTANTLQIEFGPAINTAAASLDATGVLTFNEAGTYRLKVILQFGRTGSSQTSVLMFRATDTLGNQVGDSVYERLDDADVTAYFESVGWLTVPAGTKLNFEVMRDLISNNSGGLIGFIPTPDTGTWNPAPTASIMVDRWALSP
jgi:hypothetical protein